MGLLLPAGAIGDRFGRRGVLLIGLAIFGGGALVATQLSDPTTLIAVRAVMGVGAAMIMPTTLSIITATFPPQTRDRAVGVWAGVAGGSALDGVGAGLSALGLAGIVYGFIEGPNHGWTSTPVLAAFMVGVALLVAFVGWELTREQPMLDPRLFKLAGFASGSLSVFVQFFALFGVIFVLLQYLEFVLRYTPLQAGAALAPAAAIMVALAPRVPKLVERVGVRRVGPTGLVLIALGLLVAATMSTGASYWTLLGALVLLGSGMALAAPPATAAIVGSLPDDKQGVASAVNDTAREVGGALGIAVLGSALASHVGHLGPHTDPLVLVDGFQAALHVGAAALLIGALLVFARAPRRARRPVAAPATR
ncbi:MFS transporter [Solirubrobacter phytolaccae]|uniref:MFS transporter n=1 Tax=Solirubrobacter phytolaccae TaxID=1404360 RepID=A0A9X3SA85_9ACTN|nr:MFS transporter [Solirubrobacter phytolaccae]MDA0180050.1 MFS transporter [Solirubrobacter phytolaccae]